MRIVSCAFVLLALSAVAIGQDLVAIAPKNAKIEFENEQVRVVRLKLAPHESLPMHDRPARVVVTLSANNVRLTAPDGSTRDVQVPAGSIAWSGPTRRAVENLDTPLENVVIEIKNAQEPAKPVLHPPSAHDPRALIEPDHHWLFENQYVRVYDVHDPPGHTGKFHKHAYDAVIVKLSGGLLAEQVQGQAWSTADRLDVGEVSYSADSKQPRIHRVRNEGETEYHPVVIQLMR